MTSKKETINDHLPLAAGKISNALQTKGGQEQQRSEEELKYEAELRFKSLIQLVHYLASPTDHPDNNAQGFLEYIKFRLLEPETSDKKDRSLVFFKKEAQNMLVLQVYNVDDDNLAPDNRGSKVISLYLTRKSNINVFFRQKLTEGSLPYCLVRYSINGRDEKYRFGLEDGKVKLLANPVNGIGLKSEDEVRLDLYKTLNGIGHSLRLGDPLKFEDAADMGSHILLTYADQLVADRFPNS